MNTVILQGRLTSDPETRTIGDDGKSVTDFSIAIPRPKNKDDADFIRCTAWEGKGEFIAEYFGKGDGIIIEGYLRQDRWKDGDQNREAIKVVVREVSFPMGRSAGSAKPEDTGGETAVSKPKAKAADAEADKLLEAINSLP